MSRPGKLHVKSKKKTLLYVIFSREIIYVQDKLPSRHTTLYHYVENTLIMVDDIEQPKNNVTWRWKKDVENLINFQRQYDVLFSEIDRLKHNIKNIIWLYCFL